MNPMQVAQNRTARLVAEGAGQPAVAYSTSTPAREHLMVVEWESDLGGRWWSRPMRASVAEQAMAEASQFTLVSDYDHAARCWCGGEASPFA